MVCVCERAVLVAEHSVDHWVRYCAALTKADSKTCVPAEVVRSNALWRPSASIGELVRSAVTPAKGSGPTPRVENVDPETPCCRRTVEA